MSRVRFIGAGPGDPEHLTLKGARALDQCATVFLPSPYEETFASLLVGKRLLVPFDFDFGELLEKVEGLLQEGDVGFLVPGDLAFYCPFQALIDALGERCEVIPGVGTVNAASARLKKSLDLAGVSNRSLLVSSRAPGDGEEAPNLSDMAAPGVTLVIYMNKIPLDRLVGQLREGYGANVPIALLHRLDLPGETVVTGTLDDIVGKVGDRDFFNIGKPGRPALTLVIAGQALAAEVDAAWWDFRREHVWKARSR